MNAAGSTEFSRFLFENVFEDTSKPGQVPEGGAQVEEDLVEEEPEEPPAPTFSEEEMAAAREEGYKSGREEGLKEGMEDSARALGEILQRAADRVSLLIENQARANPLPEQVAIDVAHAVSKRLLPHLNDKHGLDEVNALIKEIFEDLLDEPKITMRVSMEHREGIAAKLDEVAENYGFEGKVIVIADENMGPGDCRIEWDSGGAERNVSNIWEKVDEVFERNASNIWSGVEGPGNQSVEPQELHVPDTAIQEAPLHQSGVSEPSQQAVPEPELTAPPEAPAPEPQETSLNQEQPEEQGLTPEQAAEQPVPAALQTQAEPAQE